MIILNVVASFLRKSVLEAVRGFNDPLIATEVYNLCNRF